MKPIQRPAEEVSREGLPAAEDDEAVGEELPRSGGDVRGPLEASRVLPDDGPQHASAVQGEPRDQVEEGQGQVDRAQPVPQGGDPLQSPPGEDADRVEEGRQRRARQRAGDGDLELVGGTVRLPGDLRHAAEDEQGDRLHRDAVVEGHHAVPQLVEEHRGEKEKARDDAEGEVLRAGPARMLAGELGGEGEGDQDEDDEPGGVHPDGNAEDLAQAEALHHDSPLLSDSALPALDSTTPPGPRIPPFPAGRGTVLNRSPPRVQRGAVGPTLVQSEPLVLRTASGFRAAAILASTSRAAFSART